MDERNQTKNKNQKLIYLEYQNTSLELNKESMGYVKGKSPTTAQKMNFQNLR
jgi:hypothetical protein